MHDNRNSKKGKKASHAQTAKHFRIIVEMVRLLNGHEDTTPPSSDMWQCRAAMTMTVRHKGTEAETGVTLEFVQALQCEPQRGYHDPRRTGFD